MCSSCEPWAWLPADILCLQQAGHCHAATKAMHCRSGAHSPHELSELRPSARTYDLTAPGVPHLLQCHCQWPRACCLVPAPPSASCCPSAGQPIEQGPQRPKPRACSSMGWRSRLQREVKMVFINLSGSFGRCKPWVWQAASHMPANLDRLCFTAAAEAALMQ